MVPPAKRVCLLGAESTGKTTLAAELAAVFGTLVNPEYGRPYTEIGRDREAPWTSAEFAHIARIHCWYEDFLAGYAHRVLFCDTDAFTTAVFHEVYLGAPARGFEDLVARTYDLFVVCGLDVPLARRRDPRVRVAAAPDARLLPRAGARQRPPLAPGRGRPRGTARGCPIGRRRAARSDVTASAGPAGGAAHTSGPSAGAAVSRVPALRSVALGAVPAGREGRPSWPATDSTI